MARPPLEAVRYACPRRLPPHLPQANTSSAKLLLEQPGPSTRGVRSWVRGRMASPPTAGRYG
ncbi:hypothetical protein D7W81_32035 [Corallococcus aberystwythensis]|uniref:Uncharacterized protein n=1 Tax=Corallococcus aberystwythensis TaxID=2316722 RepID=A0A3A8PL75_9BACT|nr:hypothetical protein D7W81_32035 [Corallococcus aberystwythensis]